MLSGSTPMFSYEGESSPAAPLDPRMKVVAAVAGAAGVLIASDFEQLGGLIALTVVCVMLARVPAIVLWSSLRPVLVFVVIGGGVIAFETRGRGWSIGFAHVSRSGLELAGRLSIQLVVLLLITTMVTYTTSPFSLANALRRLLGFLRYVRVPVEDMTTMLTLAITFMPIMSREVDRHILARAARGANPRRLGVWAMLGEMLVPLMQSNLDRGEELAQALDTRLYGYGPRTHSDDGQHASLRSYLLLALTISWVAACLVLL